MPSDLERIFDSPEIKQFFTRILAMQQDRVPRSVLVRDMVELEIDVQAPSVGDTVNLRDLFLALSRQMGARELIDAMIELAFLGKTTEGNVEADNPTYTRLR